MQTSLNRLEPANYTFVHEFLLLLNVGNFISKASIFLQYLVNDISTTRF